MADIAELSLDERETHLSLVASDRVSGSGWEIYTDDPVMMRRIESAGAILTREIPGGGRFYRMAQNQVRFHKPMRSLSDEERAERGVNLAKARSAQVEQA
jgi:hypothetical protein